MAPKAQPVALRIELQEIEPLVWRRIVVSNQWTLGVLHNYLQWVMGWQDSHAHEFRVGERCIGPDWWIQEIELDGGAQSYQDERRDSVAAVVSEIGGVGGEFEYHYDMGDGWVHRCVIEMAPSPWPELELRIPGRAQLARMPVRQRTSAARMANALFLDYIGDRSPSMRTRFDGSAVCSWPG